LTVVGSLKVEHDEILLIVSLDSLSTISDVVAPRPLKTNKTPYQNGGSIMFSTNGKFLIYTSNVTSKRRLQVIGSAVTKIAETLKLEIEVAKKNKLLSTYVYYRDYYDREEIPIYCDWGKNWNEKEIYETIKSVMFALSFHPKHTTLQTIRKQIA